MFNTKWLYNDVLTSNKIHFPQFFKTYFSPETASWHWLLARWVTQVFFSLTVASHSYATGAASLRGFSPLSHTVTEQLVHISIFSIKSVCLPEENPLCINKTKHKMAWCSSGLSPAASPEPRMWSLLQTYTLRNWATDIRGAGGNISNNLGISSRRMLHN